MMTSLTQYLNIHIFTFLCFPSARLGRQQKQEELTYGEMTQESRSILGDSSSNFLARAHAASHPEET